MTGPVTRLGRFVFLVATALSVQAGGGAFAQSRPPLPPAPAGSSIAGERVGRETVQYVSNIYNYYAAQGVKAPSGSDSRPLE
jgi:hypothetical protein